MSICVFNQPHLLLNIFIEDPLGTPLLPVLYLADYLMPHSLYLFCHLLIYLDTVPSIATLYTRDRKRHDATARQWTQTYAKPKAPPPPPPTPALVEVPDNLPKTDKSFKGKNRADPQPVNNAGSSGSTSGGSSSTTGGIITIDSDEDADDERAAGSKAKSTKRKRASNGSSAPSGSEVLDLLDSEEEKAVKRSRTRKAQSRADRNSGAGVARSMHQLDDVIVVEDD